MDKHDRPYNCNFDGCEKVQGFTSKSGLNRHEREVHKMKVKSKEGFLCPFQDCNRSFGAGFTRKENHAEHIRRVHRNKRKRDSGDVDMWAEVKRLRREMEDSDLRLRQLEQAVMALESGQELGSSSVTVASPTLDGTIPPVAADVQVASQACSGV
jgi:hypothetical protein